MRRGPYTTYHGRKSVLRRILIAIVIILVIALAAAVVGLFVLPNYIVYTDAGPQLVLPLMGPKPGQSAATPTPTTTADAVQTAAQPSAAATDIVFETPTPSAKASPSVKPLEGDDLPQRRKAPLGLIPYEEGKKPGAKQGLIFTTDQVEDFSAATAQEDYDYVAVYVDAEDLSEAEVTERCLALAKLGVDELVVDGEVDWEALREALPGDTYHGYLSAVMEKEPFQNDTDEAKACAKACDRVYVPGGNWNGFNLNRYLKDNGFAGTTADVVTIVNAPLSTNYAWAVLPKA